MAVAYKSTTDVLLQALGYDGSKIWPNQRDRSEWHEELRDPGTKARQFRAMVENDAEIGSSYSRFVELLCMGTWSIVPEGKDTASKAAALFCREALKDMDSSWRDLVDDLAGTAMPWGWSVCEIVWKFRNGEYGDTPSRYTDGLLGIDRVELRPPWTLYGWGKDKDQKIVTMIQKDPLTGRLQPIPISKCIHLTMGSGTLGPEGRAGLRRLYIPYRNESRLRGILLIGQEHTGAGCWIGKVPIGLLASAAKGNSADNAVVTDFLQGLMQLSEGERRCILMPSDEDANGKPTGWDLKLESTKGGADSQGVKILEMMRKSKMIGLGTQFLELGQAGTGGSRALSTDQTAMAADILESVGQRVAEVVTRQMLRPLCTLNGIPAQYAPAMRYKHKRGIDLSAFASLLKTAVDAKVLNLMPGDEDTIRDMLTLPPQNNDSATG